MEAVATQLAADLAGHLRGDAVVIAEGRRLMTLKRESRQRAETGEDNGGEDTINHRRSSNHLLFLHYVWGMTDGRPA